MSQLGKWFGFDIDEVFEEGLCAYERGDYDGAIDAFESCLADNNDTSARVCPYLADSCLQLGLSRLAAERPETALQYLEGGLRLYPSSYELNLATALAFRELGELELHHEHVWLALQAKPDDPIATLLDGVATYRNGAFDLGVERIRQACAMNWDFSHSEFNAACEAHCRHDYQAAAVLFESLVPRERTHVRLDAKFWPESELETENKVLTLRPPSARLL